MADHLDDLPPSGRLRVTPEPPSDRTDLSPLRPPRWPLIALACITAGGVLVGAGLGVRNISDRPTATSAAGAPASPRAAAPAPTPHAPPTGSPAPTTAPAVSPSSSSTGAKSSPSSSSRGGGEHNDDDRGRNDHGQAVPSGTANRPAPPRTVAGPAVRSAPRYRAPARTRPRAYHPPRRIRKAPPRRSARWPGAACQQRFPGDPVRRGACAQLLGQVVR